MSGMTVMADGRGMVGMSVTPGMLGNS